MDIYAIVTDKIINLLEQGVVLWRRPWTSTGLPRNLVSKKPYRGVNFFLLSASKYVSPFWLTMRQANELGGHISKGEESTAVVLWKIDDVKQGAEGIDNGETGEKPRRRFLLRFYRVWNVEQCCRNTRRNRKMAWLETDRHGRLRIGFKYYDGLKCREPLGVSANKQTIAEARRLCATIQLELKARTFDYAKRFPDSDRIKQRGIETPEKIQPISVTELADSWLLSKQGEVKKSTHGYYKEVAGIFIQRDAIGTKPVSELRQEDIDRWRVRVDEKQTKANEPLSTRRKNMAWDVLNQILEFARVRKLLNEDLLLGMKPFKDSGQANDDDSELSDEPEDAEVMPYNADQIEAIIAAAEGWERALVTLYFFTGIRRGEGLALTWDRVYLDRDRALINRSLSVRYGITTPKTKSSRRMIQYGPRVRAELSKQRERVQLRSKYVFPNESGAAPNVRWATDVVWRRILTRAEVPHRPIGQCRHSFAVLALKQHKPLNWIQRQMGHRTLQMLLKHYWRWIPTDDLSAEEMSSLESATAPLASNHAHPVPTRPETGTEASS